jgi:hypothetical protein
MPNISVQHLEKRLTGLREGRQGLLADLAATDGAIQECEHWLAFAQDAVTLGELQSAVATGESLDVPVTRTVE